MSSEMLAGPQADADHDTPVVAEGFSVRDEASANWVVRRVIEARAYAERVEDWAEREVRRAKRDEAFFLGRYGHELEVWLRQRLAQEHRRRSIDLPAGTVGYRRQPPKLVILDEPEVIAWAEMACPDAVETVTRTRLIHRVLHSHVFESGELPPTGAELQDAHDSLYIR